MTLACVGHANGIQLINVLHMNSLNNTKMDNDTGTLWVFCVACESVVKSQSFSIGII